MTVDMHQLFKALVGQQVSLTVSSTSHQYLTILLSPSLLHHNRRPLNLLLLLPLAYPPKSSPPRALLPEADICRTEPRAPRTAFSHPLDARFQ
jgi:hypothetical protein